MRESEFEIVGLRPKWMIEKKIGITDEEKLKLKVHKLLNKEWEQGFLDYYKFWGVWNMGIKFREF